MRAFLLTLTTVACFAVPPLVARGADAALPAAADAASGGAPADTVAPAPVTGLAARDYLDNGDRGDKIEVTWCLSADDGGGSGDVLEYRVWRCPSPGAEGEMVATVPAGTMSYVDEGVTPGADCYYRVAAFDGSLASEAVETGPAVGRVNLFQTSRLPVLVLSAVFFSMVLVFTRLASRGADLFVRRIPGLNAVEEAVGRATEMGRPVLYVPGIAEIDDIQTIASLTILSHVAKITAEYETPLIVPTARSVVMSAAEEVVKEAYAEAGHPDNYNPDNIRYLSDAQFAFAGAVSGIMLREKPAANLYLGAFWAESLLFAETGFEIKAIQVAGTANVSQLPFFVTACDYTLLGEELYAASAYLSKEPKLLGSLKGSDWMKVITIGIMVVGIALTLLGVPEFGQWFFTQ